MWFKSAPVVLALYGIAAASPAAANFQCHSQKYLTVKTSDGPVTGHHVSDLPCVVEYLGIPYAKPPTGDRRFAPPEPLEGNRHYKAANFGPDCPLTPSGQVDYPGFTPQAQQIISYFASAAGTDKSEDCLTLNIWSKATKKSDKEGKPVIVFFHGGRKYIFRHHHLSSHSPLTTHNSQLFRLRNWQHKQPLL